MNSKYPQRKEKEIKKSKSEINFHLNFDKINAQKEMKNINSKDENSKNISYSDNNRNNSKTSEDITDYNLNENKNYTIKSLNSENSEENKQNEATLNLNKNNIYKNLEYNKDLKKLLFINSNNDNICRCCSKKFDDNLHIPILLKCNHTFCKICLGKYFTEEENIICPIDGPVEKYNEDSKNQNEIILPKKIVYCNNKNRGNNKKRKNVNSIQSLFHKSNSQKEILKCATSFNKKKNNKIDIQEKMNNYINNGKNINKYLSLTNRNKDFNINSYGQKYYNYNIQSFQAKFNRTAKNIHNDEFSQMSPYKIKKITNKKKHKHRSRSLVTNRYNSNNSEEEESGNFCRIHPEQRITHFVEETRELICIHCAFNKIKNDPNIQIKEIPEKCKEYIADLESIIDNNKNYMQIIKNSIGHINENKKNEEKKIIEIYEELTNLLITNRNNYLIKIEELYQLNKSTMDKKLENLEEIINISEKLKEDFSTLQSKAPNEFNFLVQAFNQFIREISDKNNSELHIIQYNFSHDEANKIIKYINNFADVKSKKKIYKFDLTKTEQQENKNDLNNIIEFSNLVNDDSKNNIYKRYFKVCRPAKNNSSNINIFNEHYTKYKSPKYKTNFLNYYKNSENVNEILNRYISSTNMIRDSLCSATNLRNSSIENNTNESNLYNYLKNHERLNLLKQYKYPFKVSDD